MKKPVLSVGLSVLTLAILSLGSVEHSMACPYQPTSASVASADLVLLGTVEEVDGSRARISVERYLKGAGPATVTVNWSLYGFGFATPLPDDIVGIEHLLFVDEEDDVYSTIECSGNRSVVADENISYLDEEFIIADVVAITGPGNPPLGTSSQEGETGEDEATEDTPWLIVLPLAFAIPLAVLVVPALVGRRAGGGH